MARRTPRNLSDEERALWEKVVQDATPLHPTQPATESAEKALIQPKTVTSSPRFRIGQKAKVAPPAHDTAAPINEQVAAQPVVMDRKRFQRMKRGQMKPEARIDLHGMTLAQAHPALIGFILEAVADGRRFVLVITGKGKPRHDTGPIPERHGALRHQVPHWLRTPPLRPHVLQYTEAHAKHGGMGAYYVYLRRQR